jgi:RecB family endonuclease NucS
MPLTESQMTEVEKLIGEGLESRQIADKLGVAFWSVAGVRSRMKRQENEASAEEEALVDDAIAGKFGLESDLQEALRANIGQLEAEMKVIDGGKEKTVASGRIDITAEDKQGRTVVIELKAGTADHKAIGQLLSYMGDLMADGKQVRGILIAGEFSPRAIAAARAVPGIALRQYAFQFSFQPVK